MDVNRSVLIRQLAESGGYTVKAAKKFVDDFTNIIMDNLAVGNSVTIYGFGCFDLYERGAHVCPDRRSGGMIDIPPHYIPRFYPGARMREAVREWESGEQPRGD